MGELPEMNDTFKYPLFRLKDNELQPTDHPGWWDNKQINAHHYVKKTKYEKNTQWYLDRGIKQIIIFLPVKLHFDLEKSGMNEEKFFENYGIEKKELLFNKDWSEYGD